MADPFAEVVTLLQPRMRYFKLVHGAGPWRISRSDAGQPSYCAVLDGACRMAVDGQEPVVLSPGDFTLIPATYGVVMSSLDAPPVGIESGPPRQVAPNEFRIGTPEGDTDLRLLAGHCTFGSPDASLLVSLLPRFVHVRGEPRLVTLLQLMREESRAQRPARDVVLTRLLELVLIEALRSSAGTDASPGLVRGLADDRVAAALRALHDRPTHSWTVVELAKEAALSRTTFFERFQHTVGVTPMEYLLTWRMAMAKDLLRRHEGRVAEVAERVGYGSASTFTVAFSRHVGQSPAQYARSIVAYADPA
ncbi:MAG TPA: AraC family transcriptional regulator [Luteibacter sp.]|uniref:AraC family transcriptional regulator n=1 Tax=Luteibacter sp. TaxID=1886636 RepID=UPI002C027A68|nr:AraC family transcriptional regulator [Luteibacter sp.]HVI55699.1 AraC family transcriptional regulator [Luteibacter sp.]